MNSRRLIAQLQHELFLVRKYKILPRRSLHGVDFPELVTPGHDAGRSQMIPGTAIKDDKKFKHKWRRVR